MKIQKGLMISNMIRLFSYGELWSTIIVAGFTSNQKCLKLDGLISGNLITDDRYRDANILGVKAAGRI